MSPSPDYNTSETDYQVHFRKSDEPAPPRRTGSFKTRRQVRPKLFNGMHRRRSKRITW